MHKTDEVRRRSRWILRAMEWDDARAIYPNLWHDGMPRHVLAAERVGSRLRLGDLVAPFYPSSVKHAERSERFLGLSRVVGLRRADLPDQVWVDFETAHRFDPPLDLGLSPKRVFTCCDPGWPAADVGLFRRIFDAAVSAGWAPRIDEQEGAPAEALQPADALRHDRDSAAGGERVSHEARAAEVRDHDAADVPAQPEKAAPAVDEVARAAAAPSADARWFAGAAYSGDMRDPRSGTWLAVTALEGNRLRLVRLEATGRSGLQARLRDPDRVLMRAEAIGLDFPFGFPVSFAETLLGRAFPDEGWWALARRLERLSRPEYLVALGEFRTAHGEARRRTDERAGAASPLSRGEPDRGPMAYHGIRMIAEDRSRFAIRPFESAKGRLLIEVFPEVLLSKLANGTRDVVRELAALERWPVDIPREHRAACRTPDPLRAIVAARCAAVAVLTEEVERSPEELAPDDPERVRREGWIYGLESMSTV